MPWRSALSLLITLDACTELLKKGDVTEQATTQSSSHKPMIRSACCKSC
jgi:hypothetical protein